MRPELRQERAAPVVHHHEQPKARMAVEQRVIRARLVVAREREDHDVGIGALDRIGQRDLPLNGVYSYTTTGAGVNAYIIDTGIRRTHTQFGGRAFVGFDAIGDGQNTNDCNGHGTHVSGTVGGSTYGVAKSVRLFAVRVLACNGSGSTSGVIQGVDWVTANHVSPAVANMSLGGGVSTALDTAVRNSIASGVTYAIAAGNSNTNAANSSPARVAEAITVGATNVPRAHSGDSGWRTIAKPAARIVSMCASSAARASSSMTGPMSVASSRGSPTRSSASASTSIASIGCATSISRTEKPACANTWAMPLPIVPAPTTAAQGGSWSWRARSSWRRRGGRSS